MTPHDSTITVDLPGRGSYEIPGAGSFIREVAALDVRRRARRPTESFDFDSAAASRLHGASPDRFTLQDLELIADSWCEFRVEPSDHQDLLDREVPWLAAIDPTIEIVEMEDAEMSAFEEGVLDPATRALVSPARGIAVASALLRLRRPGLCLVFTPGMSWALGGPHETLGIPDPTLGAWQLFELIKNFRHVARLNRAKLRTIADGAEAMEPDRALWLLLTAVGSQMYPMAPERALQESLDWWLDHERWEIEEMPLDTGDTVDSDEGT